MKARQRLEHGDAQRLAVGGIVSILVIAALGFALFPLFSSQRDVVGFASSCVDATFTGGGCAANTLNTYYICSTLQYCSAGVLISCSGNICDTTPAVTQTCGDNIIEGTEQCEGTNFGTYGTGTVQCSSYNSKFTAGTLSCYPAGTASECRINRDACAFVETTCGDGKLDTATEQCDDGNTANGDGCSATCKTEAAGVTGTSLSALHEEPLKTLRTSGIATNKWLVFASDVKPTFTAQPFAANIIGDKLEVIDAKEFTKAYFQKRYGTWVAWLYKDSTVAGGTFSITGAAEAYINGVKATDLRSISFQQGWNTIVVVVDAGATGWTSWGFQAGTEALVLSYKVPLFMHLNFDYSNDGQLVYDADSSAYRLNYMQKNNALPPLDNQEMLSCIIKEIEAFNYNLQSCKLSSEI